MRKIGRVTGSLALLLLLTLSVASVAVAQQATDVEVDSPVRGLEIDPTRNQVDLDVVLYNRAPERREVQFVLEDVPQGWNIAVWSRFFDYRITNMVLEPTAADPERIQQARIRIVPPEQRPQGDYSFTLRVLSPDGAIEYDSITYNIRMREAGAADVGSVSMRTDNPALQGAPGTTIGFEVTVRNDTGEETSFNLSAQPPSGWQVTFREPFGEQRVIGAVSVASGSTQRVRVDVRPPQGTPLGEYTIPVSAASDRGQASIELRADIVGRGELRLGAMQGQPLNASVTAGREGTTTLLLTNPGTDGLSDIALRADAPPNWVVDFGHPNDTIASLPANNQIEVPVTITAPSDAISGDYILTVRATHPQANAAADVRVTVAQSTVWGWLGIVLVVLVVGGMIGLFLRLGRR